MRLFVAVPVPDSIKQYAKMLRNELGVARADVKWVEYENYHLTIKFLGEVQESFMPAIVKSLAQSAANSPPFNVSAGGVGYFPNRTRPRVIWMGIKGEIEKAEFLGERVDAYLAGLGFEEEKNHKFHLTLGRIRSDKNLSELQQLVMKYNRDQKMRSFKVEEFHLMNSSLTANGPIYSILNIFKLDG